MWHYRWIGLGVAWAVAAIGATIVMLLPQRFEAQARIFVNTASILKPLMQGMTVQPDDAGRINLLSKVVVSRPNVEKLITTLQLDDELKSKSDYERLVDRVTNTLSIKGAGRDNLYTMTFMHRDPERARRGVEIIANLFIESGQGGKAGETDAAKRFIEEQIDVYEKKLREAEEKLKDFKLRYLGMTPGEGAGFFARFAEASAQLSRAQLELREAENSRDALKRGLDASEAAAASGAPTASAAASAIAEIDGRIEAMRRNLDQLLQKYTDNHPDVIGAQRVLKELEDQRRQAVAQRKSEGPVAVPYTGTGPRASEQLRVQLASAEAAVASLRIRVAEFSARHNQLKASASLMPQLEAEFQQLNRDYDVNKKNYESLVSRRESAAISGEMQSVSGVADFRVIDPPRVSPTPSPNRRLLLVLTLLLAVTAGLATAFAAREARPTVYDRRDLAEATGLPILGSVSRVVTAAQRSAQRSATLRFMAGLGSLFLAYFVGLIALSLLASRAAV